MSFTRSTAIDRAKDLAQDPTHGATLLLEPTDYERAIESAIDTFSADRPNQRVLHHTVVTAGFRVVVFGSGAVTPTGAEDLDRWIDGSSQLREVYLPYDTTARDNQPLDRNHWRTVREPGPKIVLELLEDTAQVGEVLRLEYVTKHQVHGENVAQTSVLEGDVSVFYTLAAAKMCAMAARRYAQNTGSSNFPNDVVDRRSQSDIMHARAKNLMDEYRVYVGAAGGGIPAAGFVKRFAIAPTHGRTPIWRRP